MSAMQRNKGRRGEAEIAGIVRDLTGWDVRRRVRQHDGDSDLMGVPGWAVEVKRHASATRSVIRGWWEQTVEQSADGEIPVLFYRLDRNEWRAVWPLRLDGDEWLYLYDYTVEGAIEAWAAFARERALADPRRGGRIRSNAARRCVHQPSLKGAT